MQLPGLTAVIVIAFPAMTCAQSIEHGRTLSEQHCARCHVVGSFNTHGGIDSTPSFQLLVNAFEDWSERFETFHARRPHQAFIRVDGIEFADPTVVPPNAAPVEIELDDIEAIRDFAATLKE